MDINQINVLFSALEGFLAILPVAFACLMVLPLIAILPIEDDAYGELLPIDPINGENIFAGVLAEMEAEEEEVVVRLPDLRPLPVRPTLPSWTVGCEPAILRELELILKGEPQAA